MIFAWKKKLVPIFFFTYTTSLFRETIYFFFFLGKEYIKEHKNKSTRAIYLVRETNTRLLADTLVQKKI